MYRHEVRGLHGKSYLFLTLGLISWVCRPYVIVLLLYSGHRRTKICDYYRWVLVYRIWVSKRSLHLFTVIKSLRRSSNTNNVINRKFVIIGSLIIAVVFAIFNGFNLMSSEFIGNAGENADLTSVAVTLAYPILDLILIIPSSIVLVKLRKNYQHSIPWFLSSLSLLINAIADDGYLLDFVNGHSEHLIFWDLFYVADFIIMAGALFWYNRYHITTTRRSRKTIKLEP